MNESQRIRLQRRGEKLEASYIRLFGVCSNSTEIMARVYEVMLIVAESRGGGNTREDWLRLLPSWFQRRMARDPDDASQCRWHFESWIEGIVSPGWEWWSSCVDSKDWEITLQYYEYPFRVGALCFLMQVAGSDHLKYVSDVDGNRLHEIDLSESREGR